MRSGSKISKIVFAAAGSGADVSQLTNLSILKCAHVLLRQSRQIQQIVLNYTWDPAHATPEDQIQFADEKEQIEFF